MVYTLRFLSSKRSLFHNSNVFGSCIIHILYTGCAEIKNNNSGAKRLSLFLAHIILNTRGMTQIKILKKYFFLRSKVDRRKKTEEKKIRNEVETKIVKTDHRQKREEGFSFI